MKKLLITLITLIWAFAPSLALQSGESISQLFDKQRLLYPQEKLYTHIDRTNYFPDERIWFRSYVVDATSLIPVHQDKYVYAELVDENGFVIKRVKVLNIDGVFSGYIDIPSNMPSARYFIRCYTLYSTGLSGYDCILPINIGNAGSPHIANNSDSKSHSNGILQCEDIGTKFRVWINSNASSVYNIAVIARGCVTYEGKIYANKPITFRKKDMSQGVSQFIIYDNERHVVDKRLVFSPYGDELAKTAIIADTTSTRNTGEISFVISIPDSCAASLSVSITNGNLTPTNSTIDIMPQLLFAQEVHGGVFDAERYFHSGCRTEAIDSLLHHVENDRYRIDSVLLGKLIRPKVAHETTQTVSGQALITEPYTSNASYATVNIISPKANMFATTTADKKGKFSISGLDYPDSTDYVVNAIAPRMKEKTEVRMDEISYPQIDYTSFAVQKGMKYDAPESESPLDGKGSIVLKDVVVTAANPKQSSGVFSSLADYSLSASEIANIDATCIHEVLRRIPGIYLKGDTAFIRSKVSIYGNKHAAVAIDGIILDYDYDLDLIQMQDVDRIDIFKSGSLAIWGAKGGPGVISITTKNGTNFHDAIILHRVSKFIPMGYQKPISVFTASNINDERKTIYWNGNVKMDNGKAIISIPISCFTHGSSYSIQVEGVTTNGMLLQGSKQFLF